MKIYQYRSLDGKTPVMSYINGLSDKKLKQKLLQLLLYLHHELIELNETHIKHFQTEKYKQLLELRARVKKCARLIFAIDENKDIILLDIFIKTNIHITEQSLEISRKRLQDIKYQAAEKVLVDLDKY